MESESDYEDDEIAQMEERIRALEALLGSAEEELLLSPRDEVAEHEALKVLMQYQSGGSSDSLPSCERAEVLQSSGDGVEARDGPGKASTTAFEATAPKAAKSSSTSKQKAKSRGSPAKTEEKSGRRSGPARGRGSVYVASDESYSDYSSEEESSEEVREASMSVSDSESVKDDLEESPGPPAGLQATKKEAEDSSRVATARDVAQVDDTYSSSSDDGEQGPSNEPVGAHDEHAVDSGPTQDEGPRATGSTATLDGGEAFGDERNVDSDELERHTDGETSDDKGMGASDTEEGERGVCEPVNEPQEEAERPSGCGDRAVEQETVPDMPHADVAESSAKREEEEELRIAEERLEARIVALEQQYGIDPQSDDEGVSESIRKGEACDDAKRVAPFDNSKDITPTIIVVSEPESYPGRTQESSSAEESNEEAAVPEVLRATERDSSDEIAAAEEMKEEHKPENLKANEDAGDKQLSNAKEEAREPDSPVAAAVLKSPGRATGKIAALALSLAAQGHSSTAQVTRSPSPSLLQRTANLGSIRDRYEAASSPNSVSSTPLRASRARPRAPLAKEEKADRETPAVSARVLQLAPEEVETRSRRNSIRQMQQQGLLPKPVMLKKKFDEIAAEELERSEAEQAKDLAAKGKLAQADSPARQDLIAMQRQEVFKSIISRGKEVFSKPEPEPVPVPKGKRLSSYSRAAPSGRKLPSRYRNSKRLSARGGVDQSVMLAILERRKKEDEEREAQLKKQEEEEERKREERRRREEEQAKVFRSALKRKVVRKHDRRLIWCKGKRRVYARIVPCACSSLNQGDTFVLDDDKTLYVWCGAKSNRMEKAKGAAIARIIKDHERNSHARIVTLDQYSDEAEQAAFFSLLAGSKEDISGHEEGGDDEKWDQRMREAYKLYAVEEDGSKTLLEPAAKGISMHQLVTDRCYVLDTETELYCWVGKTAPASLMKAAENTANLFFLAEGDRVSATKVPEGTEPLLFREKFVDWPDLSHPVVMKRTWGIKKKEGAVPAPAFHPKLMLLENRQEKLASEDDKRPISDGHGELEMWIVDGFRKKPFQGRVGSFHSGHCYIIHYWYRFSETERHAIYYWQGRDKNRTETGACSLLTTELYQKLRNRNDVVVAETEQELQGLESEHFVTIFNADVALRGMVVHCGRSDSPQREHVRLYHVKEVSATCPAGPAVQVELNGSAVAYCLNSRHCFIVVTEGRVFLWCGQGSSDHLRAHSQAIAPHVQSLQENVTVVMEGEESEEFVQALGCKDRAELASSYASDDELAKPQRVTTEIPAKPRPERRLSSLPVVYSPPEFAFVPSIARIFHCSQLTGKWAAVELLRFSQSDLKETDGYILETSGSVFAWLGAKSNGVCKSWTRRTAEEYTALLNSMGAQLKYRSETSGQESLLFRSHFHAWKPSSAEAPPARANASASAVSANVEKKEAIGEAMAKDEVAKREAAEIYALEELQSSRSLPDYVVRAKEQYLSDEDFETVFKMSKEQFNGLAGWRKLHLKKANKLF